MNAFVVTTILIGSAVIGLIAAELIIRLWHWIARKNDKTRMETAIMREEYLNQLYEETLYEHMDKLARQAERDMMRAYKRR